jgi:hypothetical protein
MKVGGKEIKDECQFCGEILTCELFRQGHGIHRERENITQMVRCQMDHLRKRSQNNGL